MHREALAAELLDGPLDDPAALAGNLRDLARVNRWLGGTALSRRALDDLAGPDTGDRAALTVLDVGTGAADIPAALVDDWAARGRRLHVTAVDDRAEVLRAALAVRPDLARRPGLDLRVADGRRLPWPDGAFDVAHASLVIHHLAEADALAFLRELARVSRRGVIVNDLVRSRLGWLGAWLLVHVATTNRYTRHDAPLSVRRAWTERELRTLLDGAGLRAVRVHRGLARHRVAIAAVAA